MYRKLAKVLHGMSSFSLAGSDNAVGFDDGVIVNIIIIIDDHQY